MSEEKKNPLGPVGQRIRANVAQIRESRGLTKRELSLRVAQLGRPIPVLGVSRIEAGTRRVDVDDLVALALALDVSPNRLLLPDPTWEGDVELTAGVKRDSDAVWHWACGERPLLDEGATERVRRAETAKFMASNRLPGPSPDRVSQAVEMLADWRAGAARQALDNAQQFLPKETEDGTGLD